MLPFACVGVCMLARPHVNAGLDHLITIGLAPREVSVATPAGNLDPVILHPPCRGLYPLLKPSWMKPQQHIPLSRVSKYYCPHFTEQETGAQKGYDLLRVTQEVCCRAGNRARPSWLSTPPVPLSTRLAFLPVGWRIEIILQLCLEKNK